MSGPTPMALGPFKFEALGFGFTDVSRDLDTSWAEQEVAMRFNELQWVGPKSENISITGVLFPHEFGGQGSLEGLRAAAKAGLPLMLVTLDGSIRGNHVVMSINEERSIHDRRGQPARISYRIELRRYQERASSALGSLISLFG